MTCPRLESEVPGRIDEFGRCERETVESGLKSKPLDFERFNCGETAIIRNCVPLLIRAES